MTLKCDRDLQREFERKLNTIMPCLCLTLHRKYDWGREHCKEFLNSYQRTWEEIGKNMDLSVLMLVEKETGIELRNEDGISYHELDFLNDKPLRPLTPGQYMYMRARQMRWIETAMIGVAFVALHRREGWGYTRLMRFLDSYYEVRDEYGKNSHDLLRDCRDEVELNLIKGLPT